ncbi:MAG: WD40 repeat domain-containing protein [Planctomycetota bacterium]
MQTSILCRPVVAAAIIGLLALVVLQPAMPQDGDPATTHKIQLSGSISEIDFCFSPDGKRLAIRLYHDNAVHLIDTATGEPKVVIKTPDKPCLADWASNNALIVVCKDGTLSKFSADGEEEKQIKIADPPKGASLVGRTIAIVCDRDLRLYDASSLAAGKSCRIMPFQSPVVSSEDGKLAVLSTPTTVTPVDLKKCEAAAITHPIDVSGWHRFHRAVGVAADARTVLLAGARRTLLWDVRTSKMTGVLQMAASRCWNSGKYLMVAGTERSLSASIIRAYDARKLTEVFTWHVDGEHARVSPDGKWVVSYNRQTRAVVIEPFNEDPADFKDRAPELFTIDHQDYQPLNGCFVPDGKGGSQTVLTGSTSWTTWDLRNGKHGKVLTPGFNAFYVDVAADGKRVVLTACSGSGGADPTQVGVCELPDYTAIATWGFGNGAITMASAISPDGTFVITPMTGGNIAKGSLDTKQSVGFATFEGNWVALAISADSSMVANATTAGIVIRDASGTEVRKVADGSRVVKLVFAADGSALRSFEQQADGTLVERLIPLPAGDETRTVRATTTCKCVSSDGRFAVVAEGHHFVVIAVADGKRYGTIGEPEAQIAPDGSCAVTFGCAMRMWKLAPERD